MKTEKTHGKANARILTGPEIIVREFNIRKREQRQQKRNQLVLDSSSPPFPPLWQTVSSKNIAVMTGYGNKILIVRISSVKENPQIQTDLPI